MSSPGRRLRDELAQGFVVAPFVYDGLTALIAQQAGFRACYLSGHGTAAQLGLADVGLTSFGEVVDNVRYVAAAVDVPVIADADTGFGNALNVARTVREYEAAGAAGLHLEDQVFPKRCGFFAGKQVVPLEEAVGKLRAALDARTDPDFVIIARTDALAPHGWEETLARVDAFRQAGADLVFVDGITTDADLERYATDVAAHGPTLYNGALAPTGRIEELGFALTITGGGHFLSYLAVRDALLRLRAGRGAEPVRDELRFDDITTLLGLDTVYELEHRYATTATKEP